MNAYPPHYQCFWDSLNTQDELIKAFDHLPDIYLFYKNLQGAIMGANQSFVELMGHHTQSEIIGKTAYQLCPRGLADRYTADDKTVMASGESLLNRSELNYSPTNQRKYSLFLTQKHPLYGKDGTCIGLIGITRDFTKTQILSLSSEQILPAIEYIQNHYHAPICLADLAKETGVSQSTFARSFKKQLGMTPARYLMEKRIEAAAQELLGSTKSISRIAQDVGFYDHSALTRNFVKSKQLTPKMYRQKFGSC